MAGSLLCAFAFVACVSNEKAGANCSDVDHSVHRSTAAILVLARHIWQ
jgi:hypothetical protein